MTRWQRSLLDLLYIAVESVPWFMAITLVATVGEQTYLGDLSAVLETEIALNLVERPVRAAALAGELRQASTEAIAGPPLWLVALTALGGFGLIRAVRSTGLSGALGAAVVFLASLLGLNAILHMALAGDLLVWDSSGLAAFLEDPSAFTAQGTDLARLVARGSGGLGSGAAVASIFMALIVVWVRFMAAARSTVGFARVLRSFGLGFLAMLVILIFARINGIGQLAPYALVYFVLGLLALAVANSERAALQAEGRDRVAPWSVSVTATLALLFAVAAMFGLLAALDVQSVAAWIGSGIGRMVGWLLLVILTPIFWVLVPLIELLIPDNVAERLRDMQLPERLLEEASEEAEQDESPFPGWPLDLAKLLFFVLLVWGGYRISRALLARREERSPEPYHEFRTVTGEGSGIGDLLRGLLRNRQGLRARGWLSRSPIYALYGRVVTDFEDRGFERHLSETPLEYAAASAEPLSADFVREIADAFDRARYGRHFPEEAKVADWQRQLRAWESEHPRSPELHQHLELLRPPRVPVKRDSAEEFAERVKRGRAEFRRMQAGDAANRSPR